MSPNPPRSQIAGIALLPPALRTVAERGVERRYRKGTILIEEGEPGGSLYFIMSGQLRAYAARANGEFTFGYYGAGDYMGEMSLDGGPRSASVIVEEEALCRIVTRQTLQACIAADPEVGFALMTKLIGLVRGLSLRASGLALNTAYGNLAQVLHDGSDAHPDGTRWMRKALTQAQLAQQAGCSRPMINKLLRDLLTGGYIRRDQKRWRMLKTLPHEW